MNRKEFLAELVKIVPGHKWTVHPAPALLERDDKNRRMEATGIPTSGLSRLFTLFVIREQEDEASEPAYAAKFSGFDLKAPWLYESQGNTLAGALRDLQEYYEYRARDYDAHAAYLEGARKPTPSPPKPKGTL